MPAPVAASMSACPWLLLVCFLSPERAPACSGPMAAGRADTVCGTIYQPSRRHIDFFVLPRCRCSLSQHDPPEMSPSQRCWHSSCLMVAGSLGVGGLCHGGRATRHDALMAPDIWLWCGGITT